MDKHFNPNTYGVYAAPTAYQIWRNALAALEKDKHFAAAALMRLQWETETEFLSVEETATCLLFLAESDRSFFHYQQARLSLAKGDVHEFFSEVYSRQEDPAVCYALQYAAEVLLYEYVDDVYFFCIVEALEEMAPTDARLYYWLGRLYFSEKNPGRDIRLGMMAYSKGAMEGSERCCQALYYVRNYAAGVACDAKLAMEMLQSYVEDGNGRAMVTFAWHLLKNPHRSEEDVNRALRFLEKALDYPNPVKALLLLVCHYLDCGDTEKALSYCMRVEECTEACPWYSNLWILSDMLRREVDPSLPIPPDSALPCDVQRAYVMWLKIGMPEYRADRFQLICRLQGLAKIDSSSAYYWGLLLEDGRVLSFGEKPSQAAEAMRQADLVGFIPAVIRLGEYFEKGYGVKKDLTKAVEQYDLATELGNYRLSYLSKKIKELENH